MMASVVIMPLHVNAEEETIRVYLFRGSTCEHCEHALDYINNHRDEIPDNVEIVTYEVWENDENATLMDQVATELEVDKTTNYGTPFFVVGTEYIKGYGTGTWEELFTIAENYIENGGYEDVVAATSREYGLDIEEELLDDLYREPSPIATIIVYCVFGVIVLGFIVMIFFSRRK